jgi:quaternary ammonium compound-resistance protein SugE
MWAALTFVLAMATSVDRFRVVTLLLFAGIVACAAGLKMLPAGRPSTGTEPPHL